LARGNQRTTPSTTRRQGWDEKLSGIKKKMVNWKAKPHSRNLHDLAGVEKKGPKNKHWARQARQGSANIPKVEGAKPLKEIRERTGNAEETKTTWKKITRTEP